MMKRTVDFDFYDLSMFVVSLKTHVDVWRGVIGVQDCGHFLHWLILLKVWRLWAVVHGPGLAHPQRVTDALPFRFNRGMSDKFWLPNMVQSAAKCPDYQPKSAQN